MANRVYHFIRKISQNSKLNREKFVNNNKKLNRIPKTVEIVPYKNIETNTNNINN